MKCEYKVVFDMKISDKLVKFWEWFLKQENVVSFVFYIYFLKWNNIFIGANYKRMVIVCTHKYVIGYKWFNCNHECHVS